jgi:hypothetical protein
VLLLEGNNFKWGGTRGSGPAQPPRASRVRFFYEATFAFSFNFVGKQFRMKGVAMLRKASTCFPAFLLKEIMLEKHSCCFL